MSRLTEKKKFDIHYSISISKNLLQSAYDKLGKLEDLEEQIGCPFEVVLKALNEGIYYKFKNDCKLNKMKVPMFRIIDNEYCWICPKWANTTWMNVKLKDYKNTWWLREDKSE